ncbi:hypothetical protein WJX81_008577 [Elliptochloris bilobata]|uniref:Uncharacterized protein n=1 Tax=Elliptochloris bilobata TaxID=381761 RepID=A0AAW1R1H8_9CHLO
MPLTSEGVAEEPSQENQAKELGREFGHFAAKISSSGVPAGVSVPAGVCVYVIPAQGKQGSSDLAEQEGTASASGALPNTSGSTGSCERQE